MPFWFSTEHLWTAIMPFWLSTDVLLKTLFNVNHHNVNHHRVNPSYYGSVVLPPPPPPHSTLEIWYFQGKNCTCQINHTYSKKYWNANMFAFIHQVLPNSKKWNITDVTSLLCYSQCIMHINSWLYYISFHLSRTWICIEYSVHLCWWKGPKNYIINNFIWPKLINCYISVLVLIHTQ